MNTTITTLAQALRTECDRVRELQQRQFILVEQSLQSAHAAMASNNPDATRAALEDLKGFTA